MSNFDETSVPRDGIGRRTIAHTGESHVKVITTGKDKQNFTLGVASTYTGKLLPIAMIWPTKGLRNPPKSPDNSINILFSGNNKSWFNPELFKECIDKILKPWVSTLP